MHERRLGSSPVSVSEIGLGTWGMSGAFWGAADDAEIDPRHPPGARSRRDPHRHRRGLRRGARRGGGRQGARRPAQPGCDRDQSGPEPSRAGGSREGAGRVAEAAADGLCRRLFHPLAEPGRAAGRNDGGVRAIARARDASERSASPISARRRWTPRDSMASSTCCSRPTTCCGARWRRRRFPIAVSTISA